MTPEEKKDEEWYEFFSPVGGELKKLVGKVEEELSGREARNKGLTKARKSGKFLLLDVPGVDKLFQKWKSDTTKAEPPQEEVA